MQDRRRQFDEIFLQRMAGPYIRVKPGNTRCEQMFSAPHPTADIDQWSRHVGKVPVGDVKLSYTITSPDRRLGHGSLFITSPRSASGALQSRFQGAV
jgi:hypothetical protein